MSNIKFTVDPVINIVNLLYVFSLLQITEKLNDVISFHLYRISILVVTTELTMCWVVAIFC